jgi:hypothetical protein
MATRKHSPDNLFIVTNSSHTTIMYILDTTDTSYGQVFIALFHELIADGAISEVYNWILFNPSYSVRVLDMYDNTSDFSSFKILVKFSFFAFIMQLEKDITGINQVYSMNLHKYINSIVTFDSAVRI